MDVYLSIPSNPIIEHSSQFRFAAYPSALGTVPPVRRPLPLVAGAEIQLSPGEQLPRCPRFLSHPRLALSQLVSSARSIVHNRLADFNHCRRHSRDTQKITIVQLDHVTKRTINNQMKKANRNSMLPNGHLIFVAVFVPLSRPKQRQQIVHTQPHVLDLISTQRSLCELSFLVLKLTSVFG